MTFTYTKAVREGVNLIIGLAGASGSGKTFSGMVLAEILSGDRPFRVGDTEMKRALYYADRFDFEHELITPPFTSEKYTAFVVDSARRGFRCVLIDSASHEWDGEGGCLELADAIEAGEPIPGVFEAPPNKRLYPVKSPGNWREPKRRHKKMMNTFLQADMHIIFCLRAHDKIEMIDNPEYDPDNPRRGVSKVLINHLGWMPVCEKNFLYEMTLSFVLDPDRPGIVDHRLAPKLSDDFKMMFPEGAHIGADAARALLAWSHGEKGENPNAELWRKAREVAQEGREPIKQFFSEITPEQADALAPIKRELWAQAQRADANRTAEAREYGEAPPPDDRPDTPQEHEQQAPPPDDQPDDDFPGDRPSGGDLFAGESAEESMAVKMARQYLDQINGAATRDELEDIWKKAERDWPAFDQEWQGELTAAVTKRRSIIC